MGPRIAVITLGEEGAIALENETLVRQPALPIEVYDTTGASEVFRGAFIYGQLQGWPLDRCLPFANAAAALNCRHLGGVGGIPSLGRGHAGGRAVRVSRTPVAALRTRPWTRRDEATANRDRAPRPRHPRDLRPAEWLTRLGCDGDVVSVGLELRGFV